MEGDDHPTRTEALPRPASESTRALDDGCGWYRVPGWTFRALGGRVLMARSGGDQRTIEGLALVVWVALDAPASVTDLVNRIAEAVPEARIERVSIERAIVELSAADVVEAVASHCIGGRDE